MVYRHSKMFVNKRCLSINECLLIKKCLIFLKTMFLFHIGKEIFYGFLIYKVTSLTTGLPFIHQSV